MAGFEHKDVRADIIAMAASVVHNALPPELVRRAIELHQRFQLSYWDAAILAAAKQMGCHTVFSEDLNAGQNYDGVIVINPFATDATP